MTTFARLDIKSLPRVWHLWHGDDRGGNAACGAKLEGKLVIGTVKVGLSSHIADMCPECRERMTTEGIRAKEAL